MTAAPVIDLRQAGLTYPGRTPVVALRPSDLTVHRGEFVTVVGPSGSGKSTLLNAIGLLDRPTTGSYFLDGRDTGGLGDAARTALRGHRIGFVFQAFHLLSHPTRMSGGERQRVAIARALAHGPCVSVRRRRTGAPDEASAGAGRDAVPASRLDWRDLFAEALSGVLQRPALTLFGGRSWRCWG